MPPGKDFQGHSLVTTIDTTDTDLHIKTSATDANSMSPNAIFLKYLLSLIIPFQVPMESTDIRLICSFYIILNAIDFAYT